MFLQLLQVLTNKLNLSTSVYFTRRLTSSINAKVMLSSSSVIVEAKIYVVFLYFPSLRPLIRTLIHTAVDLKHILSILKHHIKLLVDLTGISRERIGRLVLRPGWLQIDKHPMLLVQHQSDPKLTEFLFTYISMCFNCQLRIVASLYLHKRSLVVSIIITFLNTNHFLLSR